MRRAIRKLLAVCTPLQEVERNIFVLNPLAIPAYGVGVLRALSQQLLRFQVRRAMRRLGFQRPINWIFNPAAGVLAGSLGEETVIYHCVDEYTAFKGVDTSSLTATEQRLLARADLVIVSAERLLGTRKSPRAATTLVRHGVDHDHFAAALRPETRIPEEIRHLPRPVIGYFGLISEDWVDVPLLVHVARSFSTASLVMLGKATMDLSALEREPNVHLLGRKPYASLPQYCKGFDAAIIPFPISEVTLNANPLKAREYLAAGLPVVSTNIPEVRILPHCQVTSTPSEFVSRLRLALERPGPRVEVSESVRGESWEARLAAIEGHLASLGCLPKAPPGRRGTTGV
jgi:glycosyltransferase involved in cell wall biosynthesis